jgi:hypothetical protein
LVWALTVACSAPPPRTANPTRPLDERRAVEVIAEVFREEREQPLQGSDVSLSAKVRLHVDIWAAGKRFGIAYVTADERGNLGSTIPPRDPAKGDALLLVTGIGTDSDARVCVLSDSDYLYDDQVGDAHEKSTLTAELRLKRDARDFLVIARREHWK